MRLRILAGTLILLVGLVLYGVVVAALGERWLGARPLIEIAFYAVAGLVWILPAAWLTRWMQRAPPFRPPADE